MFFWKIFQEKPKISANSFDKTSKLSQTLQKLLFASHFSSLYIAEKNSNEDLFMCNKKRRKKMPFAWLDEYKCYNATTTTISFCIFLCSSSSWPDNRRRKQKSERSSLLIFWLKCSLVWININFLEKLSFRRKILWVSW